MHPVARRADGFTLTEAVVALAISGALMAAAMPSFNTWILSTRIKAASEFYLEGLRLARSEAIKRNSAARLVFIENSSNGQLDWRVDICYRTPVLVCGEGDTGWSTVLAKASGDTETVNPFLSRLRSAESLPKSEQLELELDPAGADAVYFGSTGWINTNVTPRLTLLTLRPVSDQIPVMGVSVTLAGVAASCLPEAATGDSRRCPP